MTGISYCDGTYRVKRKNSPIYIFEYIIGGEGTVISDGNNFTAKEGDIYILHKQSNHEYFSDRINPWTKIWFNARGILIDNLMQVYKLNNINHIMKTDLNSIFFKILSCAREFQYDTAEFQKKASQIFFELVLEIYCSVQQKSLYFSAEAVLLKQYLDRNNRNNITLEELSKLIYRSTSQTIRIFRQAFGVTPYQYLMKQKLELAKLMLINTNKSIKEISLEINFNDEHYFSNYFKEKEGISPQKFRKNHR
jgi:AraC-like DNA-binding protein